MRALRWASIPPSSNAVSSGLPHSHKYFFKTFGRALDNYLDSGDSALAIRGLYSTRESMLRVASKIFCSLESLVLLTESVNNFARGLWARQD